MTTENTTTVSEIIDEQLFTGISLIDNLIKFKYGHAYTLHCENDMVEAKVVDDFEQIFNISGFITKFVNAGQWCDCHRTIEHMVEYAIDTYDINEELGLSDEDEQIEFIDVVIVHGLDILLGTENPYTDIQLSNLKQEFIDQCLPNVGLIIFVQQFEQTKDKNNEIVSMAFRSKIEDDGTQFIVTRNNITENDETCGILRVISTDGQVTRTNIPFGESLED